jgi:hypothetical protein
MERYSESIDTGGVRLSRCNVLVGFRMLCICFIYQRIIYLAIVAHIDYIPRDDVRSRSKS